jgi:hypothetical protein
MAAIIKQQWPACKVRFLARDYVADMINACPAGFAHAIVAGQTVKDVIDSWT